MDQRKEKDIENDKKLLKGIWDLLDEADMVITQNGKAFDQKKLNARFILQGLNPPSNYRHIDTKQIAKKHFGFTSNRLQYMTEKLCTKYTKLADHEFPGHHLWMECLKGNNKAWKVMEKYNKHDVLALEELYHKLIPWDNSINFDVYHDKEINKCTCGNTKFHSKGYAYTNTGKFKRFVCTKCGKNHQSKINQLTIEKRRSLKK
jgi:uncharacterized protein YprB with RNaseH-like and TPR domain